MAESPSEIEGTRRKGGRRAREAADKVSGRTLICLLAGANVRLPTASSWWHVPLKLSWEEFDSQWTKRTVNQSVHLWNSYETFYILIFLSCIASISLQRVILAFCVPQYPEWGRLYALLALRNPSLPSPALRNTVAPVVPLFLQLIFLQL